MTGSWRGREMLRAIEAELDRRGIQAEFRQTRSNHQLADLHISGRRRRPAQAVRDLIRRALIDGDLKLKEAATA